jgi:hypothetical protein
MARISKWVFPSLLFFSVIMVGLGPMRLPSTESWIISSDGQSASISGRIPQPIWNKLNPVWWFLNDDEPDPPDWQLPGKPYLLRQLSWYVRNPLQNFGKYVLGICDRNYTVVGSPPVYATTWSDIDTNIKNDRLRTAVRAGLHATRCHLKSAGTVLGATISMQQS